MEHRTHKTSQLEALANDPDALARLVSQYEMYKEAFDALPEIMVIHDEQKRVVASNQFYKDLMVETGLDKEGALEPGITFEDMRDMLNRMGDSKGFGAIGDRYYDYHLKNWDKALETGEMVEFRDIEGHWIYEGVKQTPSGYYVDYRFDVSEQKNLQLQFHGVLEKTNQGIAVLDRTGLILLMNPAMLRLWGIETFAWEGKNVIEALEYAHKMGTFGASCKTQEEWNAFRDKFTASQMQKGEDVQFTLTMDTGTRLQFTRKILPSGQALFLYDDVTTLEQQKEALQEAMLEAEAGARAKSEFLANMSHEIRTPMNGVMGMAEILMRTDLDPKQHVFADTIVRSGNALLTIINDILDFSKIDAGQMTLQKASFNLTDAVEDVATLISASAAEKELELAVRVSHYLPEQVIGDAGRIRQILTNLIGNAVKFTEHGHVLVEVTGNRTELEGNEHGVKLRFKVSDTGIGIPEDKRQRIFEQFNQVDSSAARQHEGTGLGLTIASSLVDLMDGEIGVDSVVGQGSTFWFEVTLPADMECHASIPPIDVTGARILVIDDNAVNRSIISELMTAWGFEWSAASNGHEGLSLAASAHQQGIPFDLVILDYQMPGMTGEDVARKLRADENLKDVSIILLTSVDHTGGPSHLEMLNLQAQLTKPARSSLLLETMVTALQAQRSAGPYVEEITRSAAKPLSPEPNTKIVGACADDKDSIRIYSGAPDTPVDILIAEDNDVNQMVFTHSITAMDDYTFKIVPNGKEAVANYEALSPKLILMDVSMPIMNGLEATAAIRKIEAETGAHTPIIGVTAHAISGDREKCLEGGMDDYLSKPISPNMLSEKISTWLEKAARKAG